MIQVVSKVVLAASLSLFVSAQAFAATYKPFVLANISAPSVDAAVSQAKDALSAAGFELVGTYQPSAQTNILVVTNDQLKQLAGLSKHGGFGAMQRVAVVERGGKVEVSYTNPVYQWNMYRMEGDIKPVQSAMEKALGKQTEFGSEDSYSADDLREYHYKAFMPYFDDEDELEEYGSHAEAVSTIEKSLSAGKAGTSMVYKIAMPDSNMTVIGVGLTKGEGADSFILNAIDKDGHSHAAHLPYEILVVGDEAIALNGKFRIAISWPSLSMMGEGSFMSISNAPDAIKDALEAVAEK